jgi:phosphoribosyl 1,2-cyclic phosphodiesterase
MKLDFCSLSSGSSGNCYYLGNKLHGIIIDAGISAGSIRNFLKSKNILIDTVMGVLVTHNHVDHIKGLEVFTRKNNILAFTTENIKESILSSSISQKITRDRFREIPLQQKFNLAGFDIEAFLVDHDAPETIGFHICYEDKQVTIVTDLGHISETAAPYIKAADLLVIESNYDEQMLINGSYPSFLKVRIQSDKGHLSNRQTSSFLAEAVHENLKHICLAHLSKNNNTPEKALQTLQHAFDEKGILSHNLPQIIVLNRSLPTDIIRI